MNQTTPTTNTQPVDLMALRLQLEEDGKYYYDASDEISEEARERLLHTLQTNDCREIITDIVDGDDLAISFVRAANRSHIDILEAYLNHGKNIDIKDEYGWTALTIASLNGQELCVRFLLDRHASVDIQNNNGMTALMWASQSGNNKIVEMLLEKNANPDLQDKDGMTVLMYASRYGNKEIARVLLNHGVDIELKNNKGQTAMYVATNEKIKEMIQNHVSTGFVLK